MHIVEGALKDYDWGVLDGLARWHGATGTPQAELWFGTHASGPTPVITGPDAGRLLADIPEHRGMPLVKLLAAGTPLSIQVHPDASLAGRGWASGSPLFADDAEKAEMLVALEPFTIHAGWRDPGEAAGVLADAGASADVVALVRAGDPVASARRLLGVDAAERAAIARRLVDAAQRRGWSADAIRALEGVITHFPRDPGVLVAVLLDHGMLAPGDGVAVSAGVVHSYVGGLGVEVMTTSDNVLRLGLTGKQVAVDEALAAIHPDRGPVRLHAMPEQTLAPAGMPFDLVIADEPRVLTAGRHRLALALDGPIRSGDQVAPVGRAMVWSPDEPDATVMPEARMIVVTGEHQLPG